MHARWSGAGAHPTPRHERRTARPAPSRPTLTRLAAGERSQSPGSLLSRHVTIPGVAFLPSQVGSPDAGWPCLPSEYAGRDTPWIRHSPSSALRCSSGSGWVVPRRPGTTAVGKRRAGCLSGWHDNPRPRTQRCLACYRQERGSVELTAAESKPQDTLRKPHLWG
jgi:hypothetical protein